MVLKGPTSPVSFTCRVLEQWSCTDARPSETPHRASAARIRLELKQATKECKDLRAALGAAKGLYAPKLFGGADPPSELAGTSFWEVGLEDGIYATLELEDGTTLKEGIYACLAPGGCSGGSGGGGGDGSSTAPRRLYKALVFVTEVEDAMDMPDEREKNVRVMYDVVQGSGPNPEPLSLPDAHVMLGAALPPSSCSPPSPPQPTFVTS